MMRGLTYEELAAAYEMRHGYETKTPWKYIARELGVGWQSLYSAIKRLERKGLNRDADGNKRLNRVTMLSSDMLEQVHNARKARNRWVDIAAVLELPLSTVRDCYCRWLKAKEVNRRN